MNLMVLAYHVIFTCYGFWLPNDPRGSWSDWIRCWEILRYGPATKVTDRRSLAYQPHDAEKRKAAKEALKYPPVIFNGVQARAVARGFAKACRESGYLIHACSIMPDHVHLVVARNERLIEKIVGHLKAFATRQMNEEKINPMAPFTENGETPSPWAQGTGWVVYLNSREDILRSIKYVDGNPEKDGLPPQKWKFVTPFV